MEVTAMESVQGLYSPEFESNKSYDCRWQISAAEGKKIITRVFYYNTVKCCDLLKVNTLTLTRVYSLITLESN